MLATDLLALFDALLLIQLFLCFLVACLNLQMQFFSPADHLYHLFDILAFVLASFVQFLDQALFGLDLLLRLLDTVPVFFKL